MKERNETLDALKGISALLVVLGHCVQYYYLESYTQNYVFNFIYAFHMPFFMALSGYSCGYSECDNAWIKRRIVRLLVPFFVWAIIKFFLTSPLGEYTLAGIVVGLLMHLWNTIQNPSGGLWFLYVLCIESVFLWLLQKSRHIQKLTVVLMVVCIIIVLSGWKEYRFGVKYVIQYFPYVAGGRALYGWKKMRKVTNSVLSREMCVLGILLTAIYAYGVSFLRYAGEPLHIEVLQKTFGTVGATLLARGSEAYMFPLLGSVVTCLIVSHFKGVAKRMAVVVGRYTLEIYIIHTQLFLNLMGRVTEFALIEISVKLIVLTAMAIMLAMLVRKSKLLGRFLLGFG